MSSGVCMKYVSHTWSLFKVATSTRAQLARFMLVGGLGILLNLAVLWTLVDLGGMWYLPAATASFVAAVTFNFAGNKVFAFRDRRTGTGTVVSQYSKFFVVSVAALMINLAILFLLVDLGHLWYILGQVIAIVAATAGNFAGNKYWTFGEGIRPSIHGRELRAGALKAIILGQSNGWQRKK